MEIRPAVPDDAEAIETIRIRGWQTAYRNAFPAEMLDALTVDASRWREQLKGGWNQECFVCEDRGRVLGWVTIGSTTDSPDGVVYGLYVDPDAWSRGAGKALLAHAEKELARTHSRAVLAVLETNDRARRFYEHAGWSFDGARRPFERFGVSAPVVHYAKALNSSTSRA